MAGERKFARLGARLADLEHAMSDRLNDAEVLINGGCHGSAIAMGLYALEISLKIAICRRLDLAALPIEFHVHDFEGLLVLSGLSNRLRSPDHAQVKKNWDFLTGKYHSAQVNELRYARGEFSFQQSRDVLERLQGPGEGVLPWLSAQT